MELKIDKFSKDVQFLKIVPAVPTVKPPEYPDLPLTTGEQLDSFNSFLGDEDGFSYFVNIIAITGANGEKDATDRVLAKIFDVKLAMELNWKGTVKKDKPVKIGIQKYSRLVKLINESVRVIVLPATDKVIPERIQYLLKHEKT
ncbi:unnamed protein product [Allacma fusca]|uniref:DUF4806 domain-containing protein n=1 Tax=Allacma fusca TaxID=39272 RepID=A0A8J2PM50_9HEXA|nr:unnamed protein product [Allacma fusca]